jgi:ketosteroid isomerase-like protein
MKKILLLIAPALILFTSCSDQTTGESMSAVKDSTANFDLNSVKTAIMESNKAFSDAMISGDSNTVASLYTTDANMLPPNMPKIENHQGIASLASGFSKMNIKSFSLESTAVYGGPQIVTEEGKYTIGDNSGKTLDQGKYIVLWKQEDGKWKMYRDIWNSNMPEQSAAKK